MPLRRPWLWLLCCCVGCQSFRPAAALDERSAAWQLWEQGQAAMRDGRPDEAVVWYERSLAAEPALARNHLSLAAAHLGKGDETGACPHLARYLDAQPDHRVVRAHYAELLMRLGRPAEARDEFERFIGDAQQDDRLAARHLVQCHSRLMEIAEARDSDYDAHLHRGIGLFRLAQRRAALPDPEGDLSVEGLLCKAAGELMRARLECPAEARPCWYLFEVWTMLGQPRAARRWLRQAEEAAAFSELTPAERSGLTLACQQEGRERLRR